MFIEADRPLPETSPMTTNQRSFESLHEIDEVAAEAARRPGDPGGVRALGWSMRSTFSTAKRMI